MRNLAVVIFTVASLLAVGCEGKGVGGYEEAANCKQIECAPYEVVLSQDEFEIRRYENASWVATPPINSTSYADAINKGFGILFSYIQGNNKQGAKVEMTGPVLVDVFPSTGPFCNSPFVVHFYMPKKYQPDPPLSDQVHPVRMPGSHTYAAVKRFGGFSNDSNIPAQAAALDKSLKAAEGNDTNVLRNHKRVTASYSVAGYNSPFDIFNHVNEVIFWYD
ncbi:heme-binding protein 2 [Eucalyptus grandis]|uniref:heme-binding protein 2 n=1 Tax=Eucalyptus grandis TaxID=71139 RepID=UPI00192F01C4|nr:heme-binding protein 2 [Eucalyptus grandis]